MPFAMPQSNAAPMPLPAPAAPARSESTLLSRNVKIGRRRTSLRLEPAMWQALDEVVRQSGLSIHELCTLIDAGRRESSLTAAVRVFLLGYYRLAAREGADIPAKALVYRAARFEAS
jgi:predicted DNA-binding ribbon-helix-helix protein